MEYLYIVFTNILGKFDKEGLRRMFGTEEREEYLVTSFVVCTADVNTVCQIKYGNLGGTLSTFPKS
jgi:hypothetical protein